MYLHNPQRAAIETRIEYAERRKESKAATQKMTLTGPFLPSGECSRKSLRDSQRRSGSMKKIAGSYGRGLRNWITRSQAATQANH